MRMTYDTYSFLKALLDQEIEQAHKDYVNALGFIPSETPPKGTKSGSEKAFDEFSKRRHKLLMMQTQLHDAAAAMYVDHPKKDMRKFWGIE